MGDRLHLETLRGVESRPACHFAAARIGPRTAGEHQSSAEAGEAAEAPGSAGRRQDPTR